MTATKRDDRCHICHRVPVRESDLYPNLTACVDCDESEISEIAPRVNWSIAAIVGADVAAFVAVLLAT